MFPTINLPCDCVLNTDRTILGTANPTNAIGPQKAVIIPANNAVIPIVAIRMVLILSPKITLDFSPKTRTFNGFIKNKLKPIPRIKMIEMIGS